MSDASDSGTKSVADAPFKIIPVDCIFHCRIKMCLIYVSDSNKNVYRQALKIKTEALLQMDPSKSVLLSVFSAHTKKLFYYSFFIFLLLSFYLFFYFFIFLNLILFFKLHFFNFFFRSEAKWRTCILKQ